MNRDVPFAVRCSRLMPYAAGKQKLRDIVGSHNQHIRISDIRNEHVPGEDGVAHDKQQRPRPASPVSRHDGEEPHEHDDGHI